MPDTIDRKEFKRLWGSLKKAGWRARPPSGLLSDHAYLKPGVKGKLDNYKADTDYFIGAKPLWKYALREGLVPFTPQQCMIRPIKPPMGKLAAYTAANRQEPIPPTTSDGNLDRQYSPSRSEHHHTVDGTTEDTEQVRPIGDDITEDTEQDRSLVGVTTEDTEQVQAVRVAIAEDTEQARSIVDDTEEGRFVENTGTAGTDQEQSVVECIPEDTEQAGPVGVHILSDTECDDTASVGHGKEESKRGSGVANGLDEFDCDSYMDALRGELLFDKIDPADINVGYGSASDVSSELGTEEELDVPVEPGSVYESEVDSDSDFDDDSNAFQQDDTHMRQLTATGWDIYDEHHSGDVVLDAAELYDGSFGPTRSAAAFAESPLGIFFYFLPKKMWFAFAKESNAYRGECIPAVAKAQRDKQLQAQRRDPVKSVQPLEDLEEKLRKVKPIQAHEILHVIGLLIARTLCGHTDGLEKHWSTREDGAVPRGTFSRYMKRERFRLVTRYLHFTKNDPAAAATDKAWKVRPILQVLEKTFRRGYRLGPRISFDEGTIPNRSKFNPVRVYNKEKPHKYGTKVYMTCCAETGYCTRMEVYLGAVENSKGVAQKAVIRNVTKALDGQAHKRLIIADNFYTSCGLLLELLDKDLYYVGTHRNERLGWPKPFAFTQKKRPKTMPRGLYRIAHARDYPGLVALSWMDSKPVALLATGCSTVPTTVMRRAKGETERVAVPCPQLVVDYHQGMGGVDRHDQLRLQRYSIQRTVAFKKYYRQLFMGFVDMAIVNGFILHKIILKQKGLPVPTHAQYMRRLHTELLATNEATLRTNTNAEDLVSEPIHTQPHRLRNNEEKYKGKKRKQTGDGSTASNLTRKGKKRKGKRRQHLCKVCSALATPQTKSFETSYYCEQCTSNFGGYVPLCNKVRHEETGNTLTCGQIWHDLWRNGTAIPAHLKKRIRFRKRKHFEVSSDSDDGGSDANEDCVDSQDSE